MSKKSEYRLRIGPLKLKNPTGGPDVVVDEDKDIANIINNSLGEVFSEIPTTPSFMETRKVPSSTVLSLATFGEQQIKAKLGKLKANTSPGPDGVRAKMLIEIREYLAASLPTCSTRLCVAVKFRSNGN